MQYMKHGCVVMWNGLLPEKEERRCSQQTHLVNRDSDNTSVILILVYTLVVSSYFMICETPVIEIT